MQRIKTVMLPVAMILGWLLSPYLAPLNSVTPVLISVMLFVTFCGVAHGQMKFSSMYVWILLIQSAGSLAVYLALRTAGEELAQGLMICIFAPTAVAAAAIGGMLGANVSTMVTSTLISNLAVAVAAPVLLSFVGTNSDMPFIVSLSNILLRVVPILVIPLVTALVLRRFLPAAYSFIGRIQSLSFYLWVVSLAIVTARTVEFIKARGSADFRTEIVIALATLAVCVLQFLLGRRIGLRYGDPAAGAQALGQKNTILAIWMAQTYLNPLASIAPASYVLWQNMVNSLQLWRANKRC